MSNDKITELPLDVEAMLRARRYAESQCGDCVGLTDVCDACQDRNEVNATAQAWEIVDEGNMQYRLTLSRIQSDPSGHEWTERNGEFLVPSHKLIDGLDEQLAMHLNLDELDDETQRKREIECPWCHILTPRQFNDCQDCDKPLELNVR